MNAMYALLDKREDEVWGVASSRSSAICAIWERLEEELDFNEWEELLADMGYLTKDDLFHDYINGLDMELNDYDCIEVPVYV